VARVVIDEILAGRPVLAGAVCAIIDIILAVVAIVASGAVTAIASHLIDTGTLVQARVRGAVIHIVLAVRPRETL
tara:strand:+ start:246 stop:470 length:225 start_codon:yes stop_codon:yes gene_type:complete